MAEITERLKGLNPDAPEFFPYQNVLSLFVTTGTPLISYYSAPPPPSPPPQPLNPNQYYSFYFPYFHQISSTTSTTPFDNFSNNSFPAQITQQSPQNVQPATEPTTLEVPHQQQQQHHQSKGHGGAHYKKATTVPRPPRVRVGGYNLNYKRCSFDHGGIGSSLDDQNKRNWKYGKKKREVVKPRLVFGNSYKDSTNNCGSRRSKGNNDWSVPLTKMVMSKKYSEVCHVVCDGGDNTTVMIRNIPNKYTRDLLIDFLDDHCAVENSKVQGEDESAMSAYDFLYLPIDFETGCNKGYAFVNFTNPLAVWKFNQAAGSRKWDNFNSSKIREIAYAKIQGKKELVSHFETMGFPCGSEDVLPLCFDPPRDGSRRSVLQTTVGKPTFRK